MTEPAMQTLTSVKQQMGPVPGSISQGGVSRSAGGGTGERDGKRLGRIQAGKRRPGATPRAIPREIAMSPLPRTAEEGDYFGALTDHSRHSGARNTPLIPANAGIQAPHRPHSTWYSDPRWSRTRAGKPDPDAGMNGETVKPPPFAVSPPAPRATKHC